MIIPAPAQAQAVDCTSSTFQCCRVRRIWELMGQSVNTGYNDTISTACCDSKLSGIPGVTCDSKGIVTKINWENKGLKNSIPADIGSLVNLQEL
jgi:hypothetical protein